jgi:hypothetical protein
MTYPNWREIFSISSVGEVFVKGHSPGLESKQSLISSTNGSPVWSSFAGRFADANEN